jgi:signal transduction histidine kinase
MSVGGQMIGLAASPLAELRRMLEGRLSELRAAAVALDTSILDAEAERRRVRLALARAEEARVETIFHWRLVRDALVVDACRESRDLYVRLELLQARLAGLGERRDGLRAEAEQTSQLLEGIAGLAADPGLRAATWDDPRILCRRAERQLLRLIDADHEAVAEQLFEGPLEDLADLMLAVELVGRRVGQVPTATFAGEIARCRQATKRAVDGMERILQRVSPSGMGSRGLVAAVRGVAADLAGEVSINLQVVGEEPRLLPEVALAAYRVIVEAVDNARRHARVDAAEVVISFAPDRLQVLVGDGGEGFDVGGTEARLGRMGALGFIAMRERVENAGGILEIRSSPGAGTEVRAVFDTTRGPSTRASGGSAAASSPPQEAAASGTR